MRKKEKRMEELGIRRIRINRIFKSTKTRIGLVIAVCFILTAVLAPILVPNDPLLVDVACKLQGASRQFPLGTDRLGRCVLSRLIWGSRYSLSYSFIVLCVTLLIGVPIGLFSGYIGGRTDAVIMRLIDVFMALPSFIVALAIAGTLGASGPNLVFAMSIATWAEYARLARALTLQAKNQNYVMALRAGGCSQIRIVFGHILKNIAPSIIVLATMDIGSIILAIAGFSFIGLGVQAPQPEWGVMLSDSRDFIQTYPRLMMIPGIVIVIVVLAFNLLGEGFQDGLSEE